MVNQHIITCGCMNGLQSPDRFVALYPMMLTPGCLTPGCLTLGCLTYLTLGCLTPGCSQ